MRLAEVYTSGTANQQANRIADAFVSEVLGVDQNAVVHVSVSGDNRKITFAGVIETDSKKTIIIQNIGQKALEDVLGMDESVLVEVDTGAVEMIPVQHVPMRSFYTKGYATKHTDTHMPVEVEYVNKIKDALESQFPTISAGIGLMYDESDRQIKGVTVSVHHSTNIETVKSFLVPFVHNMPWQNGAKTVLVVATNEGGMQDGTFGRSGMNVAQEFYGQEEAHVTITLSGTSANSFERQASGFAQTKALQILATHHERPDEVQVELTYIQGVPYPVAQYAYITVGSNENRVDLKDFL